RHALDRGIKRIEGRADRVPIDDAARTHTVKLSRPTDTKPRNVTTETTVTQGNSISVSDIRNSERASGNERRHRKGAPELV
ncbi:hypothetical protein, partial [Mycobacterium intracellulare]|uniref:hypothetical protein n=1 Tax=Mycobacterium intracellulare TaxID=1767 RepID=UPI001CDA1C43